MSHEGRGLGQLQTQRVDVQVATFQLSHLGRPHCWRLTAAAMGHRLAGAGCGDLSDHYVLGATGRRPAPAEIS